MLLAKSQNCKLTIESVLHVSFIEDIKPFKEVIHIIQSKRREHPIPNYFKFNV